MEKYAASIMRLVLGEEYASLCDFFHISWNQQPSYRYRVYLAQKGLNLNEIFFEEACIEEEQEEVLRLKQLRRETFLSQGGLLLKADELAREYRNSVPHAFPRILIIDEILFSGRDFAELFYALEKQLQSYLAVETDEEKVTLREALADAIFFRAYMQDERGAVIETLLAKRMQVVKRVSQRELHQFAVQLTAALSLSPSTANTAFLPTFYLNSKQYEELSDLRRRPGSGWGWHDWRYKNREATIWRFQGETESPDFYCSILSQRNEFSGLYSLTPYIFWHGADSQLAERFFYAVGALFDGEDSDCQVFRKVLHASQTGLYGMKLKLLCAIASIALVYRFLGENLDGMPDNDLEKIAQSFGLIKEIYPAFEYVSEVSPRGAELRNRLISTLQEIAGSIPKGNTRQNEESANLPENYLLHAENYFAKKQFDGQELLSRRRREKIPYLPWSAFYQMDKGLEQYLADFPQELCSYERKMDALLLLLQNGYITLNKLYTDPEENGTFYLKAGESTAILVYQHMYRFMPALVRLESICRKNGLVSEDWAARLGERLIREGEDADLPEVFRSFIDCIHSSGQRLESWMQFGVLGIPIKNVAKGQRVFRALLIPKPDPKHHVRGVKEWDGKPWSDDEQEKIDEMDALHYVIWEQELQKKYFGLVTELFN